MIRVSAKAIERNTMLLADGSVTWRYDVHGIGGSWHGSGDTEEQWQVLGQVAAPTLVLRGAQSPVFTPDVAQRTCSTLPTARLVEIPEAGHPITMDQPALFLSTLLAFLLQD